MYGCRGGSAVFHFSEKMKIKQIQEFKLFDRRSKELRIVRFHRIWWGAFEECFRMELTNQKGEILNAKPCTEEYADYYLRRALGELPFEDVEITKFEPVDVSRPPVSNYF
jgi:hypothetical protein